MQIDFEFWVKNRLSSLVSFANAGTDLVSTTVQAALVELANRHFGKNFAFNRNAGVTSTGGTGVLVLNSITTTSLPLGNYLVVAAASIQKTAIAGQIETWIADGATELNRDQLSMDDDDYYFGMTKIALLENVSGIRNLSFNMQKVNGGGNILAQNRTMLVWRLN